MMLLDQCSQLFMKLDLERARHNCYIRHPDESSGVRENRTVEKCYGNTTARALLLQMGVTSSRTLKYRWPIYEDVLLRAAYVYA